MCKKKNLFNIIIIVRWDSPETLKTVLKCVIQLIDCLYRFPNNTNNTNSTNNTNNTDNTDNTDNTRQYRQYRQYKQ